MNKLDKQQKAQRDEIIERLREAQNELSEEIGKFNAEKSVLFENVRQALEKYNEVVSDAESFRDEIAGDIQNYFDDRSEKWQEGDRGQAYQEWQQEWENLSVEQVDMDEPDDIEEPETPLADELEALPEEFEFFD